VYIMLINNNKPLTNRSKLNQKLSIDNTNNYKC